jgi:O-succinylbenzoate synthase
MIIEEAEILLAKLPLRFRFETSFGVSQEKWAPLLILRSEGVEGYSEGVMEPSPVYREEWTEGSLQLLRDQLLPAISGRDLESPEDLQACLRPFRGNHMAKAMVEMAWWDLRARQLDLPLWQLLGGTRRDIPVGVSLGIQGSIAQTLEIVGRHLELGYRRIKLKIKPGWDLKVLEAVRGAHPEAVLTADANSSYQVSDLQLFQRIDQLGLDYIEQPLAYDDLVDHAKLQGQLSTSICLDESVLSPADARKALQLDAGRVINIKVGRVGGHLQARRVHDIAQAFGIPVWCGGMLETGVGRAHNLQLSTLPGFSKPGDTSSASRYFTTDLVEQPLEAQNGLMPLPEGPGIGVTLNRDFLAKVTQARWTWKPA